jgi:type IV secretory pathway VirB3-like protein
MDKLLKLGAISGGLALIFGVLFQATGFLLFSFASLLFAVSSGLALGIVISVFVVSYLNKYLFGEEEFMTLLSTYRGTWGVWLFICGLVLVGIGFLGISYGIYYLAFTGFVLGALYLAFAVITYLGENIEYSGVEEK